MKKTTKRIGLVLTALTAVSVMSAMAIGASAEKYNDDYDYEASDSDYGCGDYFGKPLPKPGSFKADPNAPHLTYGEMVSLSEESEKISQYDIKAGEYYLIRISNLGTVGNTMQMRVTCDHTYDLIKVTKVYEEPTCCGSERKVEFTYCDTGATDSAYAGKTLVSFYKLPESAWNKTADDQKAVKPIKWLNNNVLGEKELKRLNIDDIVRNPESGFFDYYYDTYRGNGVWQHVGSHDMVKYVGRTLGENDPRYKALVIFYNNGRTE